LTESTGAPARGPTIVIEAGRTEGQYWRDLWRYRELLYFLTWRDVVVRYKQTAVGVAWALLRPLLTMIIFTVVFGKLAGLPSGGVPYPILVFAALLPWQLFANALSESGSSLVSNANLISKVYFPRLIVPVSAVLGGLVDFLVTVVLLLAMMVWYGVWPTWRVATLPLFILQALTAATGAGVWLSALNVRYRDFRYIIPFIVQFGLYLSPVGFSSNVVPEEWRWLYSLNPMVGVIDGFRWALLGAQQEPYWPGVLISVAASLVLLIFGLWYFRKTEQYFADII
jgi:lipopolysaccharide transport system permease protein